MIQSTSGPRQSQAKVGFSERFAPEDLIGLWDGSWREKSPSGSVSR